MDSIREPQELITSNIIKDLKDKKKMDKRKPSLMQCFLFKN